jgi:hypothetical protein
MIEGVKFGELTKEVERIGKIENILRNEIYNLGIRYNKLDDETKLKFSKFKLWLIKRKFEQLKKLLK